MRVDRQYLLWGLVYAIAGMALGIYMASSANHIQHVTHAHILLVGFVLSLIYAVIHRLWLQEHSTAVLAKVQFFLHQGGALLMSVCLFLLYGALVPQAQLDPFLGIASVAVITGAILMFWLVLRTSQADMREAA